MASLNHGLTVEGISRRKGLLFPGRSHRFELVLLVLVSCVLACSDTELHPGDPTSGFRPSSPVDLDLSQSSILLVGGASRGEAGQAISAGDINGDGVSDLAIGAPAVFQWVDDFEDCCQGRVYLVNGPVYEERDLGEADAIIEGAEPDYEFGWSLDVSGDMNGDGFADLLAGSHGGAPAAYLFNGPLEGHYSTDDADATFMERDGYRDMGWSVSFAGDVDGDGLTDAIIYGGIEEPGGDYNSEVLLFLGPQSGILYPDDADARVVGQTDCTFTPGWVACAGDTNGDGYGDVLVSVDECEADDAVLLFQGPLAGELDASSADAMFVRGGDGAEASLRGARAGDINGDGLDDVLVGDRLHDDVGAVYLFYGPFAGLMEMDNADAILLGENHADNAGFALAGAGDLDQDGYGDILVGAPGTTEDSGVAYLAYGPLDGEMQLADADARMAFDGSSFMTGIAVAPAGDFDGDGMLDIAIGAREYDDGERYNVGAVVVVTQDDLARDQGCACSAGREHRGTLDREAVVAFLLLACWRVLRRRSGARQ